MWYLNAPLWETFICIEPNCSETSLPLSDPLQLLVVYCHAISTLDTHEERELFLFIVHTALGIKRCCKWDCGAVAECKPTSCYDM